jgi:hypothetical protein
LFNDTWFQIVIALFAVAYVVLTIIRIRISHRSLNESLEQRRQNEKAMLSLDEQRASTGALNRFSADSISQSESLQDRAEQMQARQKIHQERSEENTKRWSDVLTRIESLVQRLEDRGAD